MEEVGNYETWSGEESEDAEDLAELEARLYSQYHYQEDFLEEESSTTITNKDDQLIIKNEDNLQQNDKLKCDKSLPVEQIQMSVFSNFTETKKPSGLDKQTKLKRPRQLSRNPLYTQTSDGESSDNNTSEDEGIIALSSDHESDHGSHISFETIISKHVLDKKEESRARLVLDSYKQAIETQKFDTKTKKKKDFYVDGYIDSDISEFIDSDFEILSDDEYEMKLNIKHQNSRIGIREEELQELNRKSSLVPDKWNTEMDHFYTHIEAKNLSITAADLLKDTAGAGWKLDLADIYKTSKSRRYFFSKGRCTNCSQPGHYVRQCPEPIKDVRCSMCGLVGHRDQRCPGSCCLGCGNPDNFFRNICPHCKFMDNVVCKECGYHGHKKQRCPDIWRRFHNTVPQVQFIDAGSEEPPLAPEPLEPRDNSSHKKPSDQWCCNCGRRGHLVDGCRRRQYSQYPVRPVTVQSYSPVLKLGQQEDHQIPNSKKKKEKKRKQNFEPDSQLPPPKKRRKTNNDGNWDESYSSRKWDESFTKKKQQPIKQTSWLGSLTRSLSPIPAKKRKHTNGAGKLLSKKQREKKAHKEQLKHLKTPNNFQGHFASEEIETLFKPRSNNKKQKRFNEKNFKKGNETPKEQQGNKTPKQQKGDKTPKQQKGNKTPKQNKGKGTPNHLQKFEEKKAKASKKKIRSVFTNPQFRFATNGDMSLRKNTHVRF